MLRQALTLALLGTIVLVSGCGRAFTEGLGSVTGAKGITVVIDPISPYKKDNALGAYSQVVVGKFTDEFGRTPPQLLNMLPEDLGEALTQKKIPNHSGGKTLVVRGKVVHYEDATKAISQVFGPFEEVVARVELVDKETGKVLGVADCIGRSTETVNQGVEKKSAGLAKAIAEWIAQHHRAEKD